MSSKTFEELGISFQHTSDSKRYVPSVDAVLFVLGIGNEDSRNPLLQIGPIYTANVHRAAVAASFEIRAGWIQHPTYQVTTRRIIGREIVNLCSKEARCLLNNDYREAKRWAGDRVPPKDTGEPALMEICICPDCRKTKQLRALSTD